MSFILYKRAEITPKIFCLTEKVMWTASPLSPPLSIQYEKNAKETFNERIADKVTAGD